jgi:hypothetical protein
MHAADARSVGPASFGREPLGGPFEKVPPTHMHEHMRTPAHTHSCGP